MSELGRLLDRLNGSCAPPAEAVAVDEPPAVDVALVRAAAFDEGFALGQAAAAEAVAAEREAERAAVAAAVQALQAARVVDEAALRGPLIELVRAVAERVLMAELGRGADVLAPLAQAALAQLRPGEAAVLRARPEVLAGLGETGVAGVADAGLGPDEVRVECGSVAVRAGLMARLDELMEGLS